MFPRHFDMPLRTSFHLTKKRTVIMTATQKKKLISTNAGVWAIAILTSFILPFVAESLSSGPAEFLKVMCFAAPLVGGMMISTATINKSIPEAVSE